MHHSPRVLISLDLEENAMSRMLSSLAEAGITTHESSTSAEAGLTTLLALRTPSTTGLEQLSRLRRSCTGRLVVTWVQPAQVDDNVIWQLLSSGADDVIELGSPEAVGPALRAKLLRWHEIDTLVDSPLVRETMVGRSTAIRRLATNVVEAARSNAPVLVEGESGTGKELVAGLLHKCSPAASKERAVLVDCSTLHTELALSELFGHEAGAFTGATAARSGAIPDADGGTLLLDEIGELPLPVQAQLLRFLQEGQVRRVGSNRYTKVSARVVAATNRSLRAEVGLGRFREDLYHRLCSIHIRIPPLRERREDIPDLIEHFLVQEFGITERPTLSRSLATYLYARDYPGNVRELRQLVRSIAVRHAKGSRMLTPGDLPEEERPNAALPRADQRLLEHALAWMLERGDTLKDIERRTKEIAIRLAIARHDGDRGGAARSLDVTARTLLNHQNEV